jgi:peptidoglycan/LPS O-acetylase OafA/YrhL
MVILSHGLDSIVSAAGVNFSKSGIFFVRSYGLKGVTLFFSISGFLITYLLIREQEANG